MADKERVDLPADFDALLREAMAVEPSPAFLPLVRERVAAQHRPTWWRARWIPAAGVLGVVAALAVAVALPALTRRTAETPKPPAPPVIRLTSIEHPQPVLPPIVSRPAVTDARRTAARRSVAPGGTSLDVPPVIVDSRQRAVLSTFVRLVQQGRVSDEALPQTAPSSATTIEERLLPMTVEPVRVSTIPVSGVLSSGTERH